MPQGFLLIGSHFLMSGVGFLGVFFKLAGTIGLLLYLCIKNILTIHTLSNTVLSPILKIASPTVPDNRHLFSAT